MRALPGTSRRQSGWPLTAVSRSVLPALAAIALAASPGCSDPDFSLADPDTEFVTTPDGEVHALFGRCLQLREASLWELRDGGLKGLPVWRIEVETASNATLGMFQGITLGTIPDGYSEDPPLTDVPAEGTWLLMASGPEDGLMKTYRPQRLRDVESIEPHSCTPPAS